MWQIWHSMPGGQAWKQTAFTVSRSHQNKRTKNWTSLILTLTTRDLTCSHGNMWLAVRACQSRMTEKTTTDLCLYLCWRYEWNHVIVYCKEFTQQLLKNERSDSTVIALIYARLHFPPNSIHYKLNGIFSLNNAIEIRQHCMMQHLFMLMHNDVTTTVWMLPT